jgi:prepilin-type processing-associated H-X9-DG protein
MPVDIAGEPLLPAGNAAHSVRDLQTIGGFDFQHIVLGNYSSFPAWGTSGTWLGEVVQCDYNYRNQASTVWWPLSIAADPALIGSPAFIANGYGVTIYGVSPDCYVLSGEPVFKTQKKLLDRAIVTDSWSAHYTNYPSTNWQSAVIPPPASGATSNPNTGGPGCGYWAHREGYNVLYGDWHAKWYGDGQGQLLWFQNGQQNWGWFNGVHAGYASAIGTNLCSLHTAGITMYNVAPYYGRPGWNQAGGYAWNYGEQNNAAQQYVWHLFDNDAGIDVGALGGYSFSYYGQVHPQQFGGFNEVPTIVF